MSAIIVDVHHWATNLVALSSVPPLSTGTQQLQWVTLGETCDNRRLNVTDEAISPMWHPLTPPSSVPSLSTGAALKAPHEDTQWTVASAWLEQRITFPSLQLWAAGSETVAVHCLFV